MEYDQEKVDDCVLALLYMNFHNDQGVTRAWKSFDWGVMDRLCDKGFISNPKTKAKSVVLTEEGEVAAEEMFRKHFGK